MSAPAKRGGVDDMSKTKTRPGWLPAESYKSVEGERERERRSQRTDSCMYANVTLTVSCTLYILGKLSSKVQHQHRRV